eukprot:TCALIF_00398-PA protein Name:"Similar to RPA1 Replication protein A 70 kDa DNA-binding subunit (Homo sapiens)" AED:0.07 eAED:0.07 QI:4/0.83/0.85/1/0.5/0.57/7/130/663
MVRLGSSWQLLSLAFTFRTSEFRNRVPAYQIPSIPRSIPIDPLPKSSMSVPSLSEGALLKICQGDNVDKPILQVLGLKKLANQNSSSDRYRVFVSDGQYSNSFSMLATQMNDKIINGSLVNFCLIRANNYVCNKSDNRKVIILYDVDVLTQPGQVSSTIGEPTTLNPDGTVNSTNAKKPASVKRAAESDVGPPMAKRSPLTTPNGNQSAPKSSILDPRPVYSSSGAGSFDPSQVSVHPIASLTPYQNKWTIKARVTHKSDIRRWNNSRGEGHLFSMDLLDESGEIRATAFKEQCDKYYNVVEVGKLYYVTSCSLKAANKQYSTLNNEYEMTFRDSTEVIPCNEDASNIPTITFNFVKIKDLAAASKDSVVDVMGICKEALDATTLTSQRTQKEFTKRDIRLVDNSCNEVNLTLWGQTAETFDGANNPVVVVKNCKVSDYNGVSLSALSSSVIQINPDMPQAHSLKGWFESEGQSAQTQSLTQLGARGGADGSIGSNLKTLGEVKIENLGMSSEGKPEFYSTSAYIVVDQGNDQYRCEKCNSQLDGFTWRIVLSFSIADSTDNTWVTCFQEQAETILNKTAEELGALYDQDQDGYNKVFQAATFKHYDLRLSCKAEHYNDEQKVRHTVRSVVPINYDDYKQRLIKDLESAGIEIPDKLSKGSYL